MQDLLAGKVIKDVIGTILTKDGEERLVQLSMERIEVNEEDWLVILFSTSRRRCRWKRISPGWIV